MKLFCSSDACKCAWTQRARRLESIELIDSWHPMASRTWCRYREAYTHACMHACIHPHAHAIMPGGASKKKSLQRPLQRDPKRVLHLFGCDLRGSRTPNLSIWSRTRYHCAMKSTHDHARAARAQETLALSAPAFPLFLYVDAALVIWWRRSLLAVNGNGRLASPWLMKLLPVQWMRKTRK